MNINPPLIIDHNIDDPTLVIENQGVIHFTKKVKHVYCAGIYATHGYIRFDGSKASCSLNVDAMIVDDPRTPDGEPSDGFHLGGVSGWVGEIIGANLRRDMGKIGSQTRGLIIQHSTGFCADTNQTPPPGALPGHEIVHQDGWQVMSARDVTFQRLDFFGGPNTNHAALYCAANKQGINPADPLEVVDILAESGTIITKAAGIALGCCTRCGASNMDISAHYPFETRPETIDPVNVNNHILNISIEYD